jgi:hypothetical protein
VETVTLPDGTVLPTNTNITLRLTSGSRTLWARPRAVGSGGTIFPGEYIVLARYKGSFEWFLVLVPDGRLGWIRVRDNDQFAIVQGQNGEDLLILPEIDVTIPTPTRTPSITNTPRP